VARRVLNDREDPRDRIPSSAELGAALPPLGALARTIVVGRLRVHMAGLDEPTATLLDDGYRGFAVADAGSATTRVDVLRSPEGRWLHLPRDGGAAEEARVNSRSTAEWLELWSYGFAGRFDREARMGRLLLCDGAPNEVAQAVENYLRFCIAAAALAAGGFLLHSAGVARGGRAWLFFGPSGAGKSTTASHAPADAQLLGDDLVLVEPPEGDAPPSWRACGVPFRGSFARGDNAAACAPIVMACRLVQDGANRLADTSRVVRIGEVLAQVPFLMDDALLRERAAERVEAFVRDVPVRRLHLRRDPSYWSLIEP
jgi:hypothetical protein